MAKYNEKSQATFRENNETLATEIVETGQLMGLIPLKDFDTTVDIIRTRLESS